MTVTFQVNYNFRISAICSFNGFSYCSMWNPQIKSRDAYKMYYFLSFKKEQHKHMKVFVLWQTEFK